MAKKPKYSELYDNCVIERHGDIVLLKTKRKHKSQSAPEDVFFRSVILRSALQFASMHYVVARAIRDEEGNFLCFMLMATNMLSQGELVRKYMIRVGFGPNRFDHKEDLMKFSKRHKTKSWRNIRHEGLRI